MIEGLPERNINSSHPQRPKPATEELVADFKGAMRRFASSVTVITAGEGDARRGLTATAVSSVTMDPPTLLICVNRFGEAHGAIQSAGTFCVNILSIEDDRAALCFAGQSEHQGAAKFDPFPWSSLETGAPALDGALASIDCEISDTVETASHTVYFGRVVEVRLGEGRPLVHFDREFYKL